MMKNTYRECDIEVKRENALGGWSDVYWSAFAKDGYEIVSGFGGPNVREMFKEMKHTVDEFLDTYKGVQEDWETTLYSTCHE